MKPQSVCFIVLKTEEAEVHLNHPILNEQTRPEATRSQEATSNKGMTTGSKKLL